jgi:glutaminase
MVTVEGHVYAVGDTDISFTIQSISKPLTYGIALEDKGADYLRTKVNVEPSGEAFNRISLEHKTGRPRNAMINAGAITTVSQVNGDNGEDKFSRIIEKYSLLAGKPLQIDNDVYQSEKSTGHRNRAISHMLLNSGVIEGEPEDILDAYIKQCSILVTCKDLAIMAATLANQGRNPITGIQAINKRYVPNILSIMSSCGMYDGSGAWTYDIGLPAKSGVGGGIIAVLPGKSAIAVFSPRLNSHGNSVRGIEVCQSFSDELGLHIFKSDRQSAFTIIRASYTIDEVPSKRMRSKKASSILSTHGKKVRVYELTGELGFSAAEVVLSQLEHDIKEHEIIILGLRRVTSIDQAATQLIARMTRTLNLQNKQLILSDTHTHATFLNTLDNIFSSLDYGNSIQAFDDIDHATEWCENYYLTQSGHPKDIIRTTYLSQQEILSGLSSNELDFLVSIGSETRYKKGDYLCRVGEPSTNLYFILSGYVSIMIPLESRRQQRLATFDAGSAIGEFSVVDKRPRSANIVANTDVTCHVVDFRLIEQNQSEQARNIRSTVIENLALSLVERIRKANTEIRALSI